MFGEMSMGNIRKVTRIFGDDDDPRTAGGFDHEVDAGYAPSDFIIPGSDHQGHSERIYCRCQPQHARAIGKILASRKFPFRTQGDVLRWCVVRGLKVLDRLDPMPGFIGMADAINEILKEELYLQEFTSMFNNMQVVIQGHIAMGAVGEARKVLTKVLMRVRTIEEEHWRKKAEEEIRTRFAHLLEGGGKVSLRTKDDGEAADGQ
jgi:hypothetical protein